MDTPGVVLASLSKKHLGYCAEIPIIMFPLAIATHMHNKPPVPAGTDIGLQYNNALPSTTNGIADDDQEPTTMPRPLARGFVPEHRTSWGSLAIITEPANHRQTSMPEQASVPQHYLG